MVGAQRLGSSISHEHGHLKLNTDWAAKCIARIVNNQYEFPQPRLGSSDGSRPFSLVAGMHLAWIWRDVDPETGVH